MSDNHDTDQALLKGLLIVLIGLGIAVVIGLAIYDSLKASTAFYGSL